MSKEKVICSRLSRRLKLNHFAYKISKAFLKDDDLLLSADEYRKILNEYSPKPDAVTDGNNTIHDYEYDLQIIYQKVYGDSGESENEI